MGESLTSEETIREYLLGRVSDEASLEGIEELLFTDEEFCSRLALAEDGLINDFVLGYLDETDAASFRATLAGNSERRLKLEMTRALRQKALARSAEAAEGLEAVEGVKADAHAKADAGVKADAGAPSFFDSLNAFFRRPKYAAAVGLVLVAVLGAALYFAGGGGPDELAELRAVYRQERPTETRLSGFGYAPLTQLRGAAEQREKNRLRRIENGLLEAAEKSPNAQTHHALGVFLVTQRRYADAVKEFESALRFDAASARIHNDLGAAHFELAQTFADERKFEELPRSLEEFTAATERDGDFLEALFNKALALQELKMPRQAREAWTLYLRKDQSSPWAEEARRHLARLDAEQAGFFKSDEEVLSDFLDAYRKRDDARAQKIHHETKGLLKEVSVPLQLSRRLLLAKRRGDEAAAAESLAALDYIADFERERHSEFFFPS